jgi:hypothetical protein
MKIYHGYNKTKKYFEGWYFKHQLDAALIAFIPGVHMDGEGKKEAFIQVLTDGESYYFPFPFDEFSVSKTKFEIRMGKNIFSESGISLDIDQMGARINGRIGYGRLTPIAYNIMGPFAPLPMECLHAVHSLRHTLDGSIKIQNRTYDFSGGIGYIEHDWGKSFPEKYLWLQTNDLAGREGCLFVSVAKIPFLARSFEGCISIVYLGGKEYRLATYLGVRVLEADERTVLLKQGGYLLHIEIDQSKAHPLLAPADGEMSRTIRESSSAAARIRFYKKRVLLLDAKSTFSSFEYVP